MEKVIIKLNGGRGALLCNGCDVILSYGSDHNTKTEHYCGECYRGESPERMAEWLLDMDDFPNAPIQVAIAHGQMSYRTEATSKEEWVDRLQIAAEKKLAVLEELKTAANDARDAACVAYELTRDDCDAAYNARNIVIIAARDADAAYEAELKKSKEQTND